MKKYFVVFMLLSLVGCSSLARDGGAIRVQNNYEDGDYHEAISIADRIMHQYDYDESMKAMIRYYKAMSLEAINDINGAIGVYRFIKENHANTEYGYMASEKLQAIAPSYIHE